MAKKRKAAAKNKSAAKPKAKNKGIIDRVIEAITPTRRNSKGGNITRRQGV